MAKNGTDRPTQARLLVKRLEELSDEMEKNIRAIGALFPHDHIMDLGVALHLDNQRVLRLVSDRIDARLALESRTH